ncbi:FAD-linked oxidase C-terminal domain-containing protein [Oricola sp.]|uniref:FAD-binding oxidoreductase n=1 Tax=Oricola sp. TaxID=1979950 RepID=UPI0025E3BBD2|nr:FAD-linked oxidase C-terminal domain-containing protein [Oricola sp.]MCI5076077.1 FAD-binding protein [Oricola sp.]
MALREVQPLQRNESGIAAMIATLGQRFGDRLTTGMALREQHGHTLTYIPNQPPDAVFFAHSTEEVQEAVRVCAAQHVPVIPFGTGTSLEGGVNAPAGGLCIDLGRMDAIVKVNAEDLDAVVQPGVTREALNVHLRDAGLFFPIDPGANASLGGMAATRASGTNAVRYGTMRENVISVTAVMPDGSAIRTGGRARKSSAGYDLTRLLVGSEGTLGIITELTVRLYGIPEAMASAVCSFPDVEAACNATIMAMQAGIPVARIELMDRSCVEAVNAYSRTGFSASPLLLLEFHGSASGVREQSEFFGEIAAETGGSGFEWVADPEDRARMWKARHDVYFAMQAAAPGKRTIANDACVPISRLADCVAETERDIAEAGLYGPVLGHVGDGNFHVALFVDSDDADELARAEGVLERLSRRAMAMDGTCTGEHGIGQGKRAMLRHEHGNGTDFMAAIKHAFDPRNIMNPGKVIPD